MHKGIFRSSVSLMSLAFAGLAQAQPATVPSTGPQPGAPMATEAASPPAVPGSNDAAAAPTSNVAAGTAPPASSASFLDAIVVTGSRQGKSLIRSSNSVTALTAAQITQFTPRTEADVLHLIPGIRVESTAGEGGNSNITVRGLPLASGGAKYVQLQEDGLPDVEFGDIAFGNNDYWLRYDYTVDSVQAVRGGNASTGASQAPGAIINYISKTGLTDGGKIGVTTGLDYNETRVDFDYGGHLSKSLRFNIGGFYRNGDGARPLPYNGVNGYQVKANITKELDDNGGYLRLNFKRLDDRSPSYTSAPFGVRVSGNTITGYYPLPGFDARSQSGFSKYNLNYPYLRPDAA